MTGPNAAWEERIAGLCLWQAIDDHDADDFVARIDALVAELPPGSAMGCSSRAGLHADSDELCGAVRAFLALALVDLEREREAGAISLTALSHYLPRYQRSLARYALALGVDTPQR